VSTPPTLAQSAPRDAPTRRPPPPTKPRPSRRSGTRGRKAPLDVHRAAAPLLPAPTAAQPYRPAPGLLPLAVSPAPSMRRPRPRRDSPDAPDAPPRRSRSRACRTRPLWICGSRAPRRQAPSGRSARPRSLEGSPPPGPPVTPCSSPDLRFGQSPG
jgi:hypothetical protein